MNEICLNILDAIVSCDYLVNNRDLIISIFFDTFQTRDCQIYLTIRYNASSDKFEKILVVRMAFQINFKGNKYDVSTLIYFPRLFPAEVPQFFIEKTEPIGVNQESKIVDKKTLRINTPTMNLWNINNTNINKIFEEISKEFHLTFPVYKLDKNTKSIDYGEDCLLFKENLQKVTFDAKSKMEFENPFIDNSYSFNNNSDNSHLISLNEFKPNNFDNSIPINSNIYANSQINSNINSYINKDSEIDTIMTDEKVKQLYTQTLMNKIKSKAISSYKLRKEEERILNNFKASYNKEIEDIKDFVSKKESIIKIIHDRNSEIVMKAEEIKRSIENINLFLNNDKLDLTKIATCEKNKESLDLICKLAVVEEILIIIKKAFEKKIIDLNESICHVRRLTKEILVIKYCISRNLDKNI